MSTHISRIETDDYMGIVDRITQFYRNAMRKYPHTYSKEEVQRDIDLALSDMNLSPCRATNEQWRRLGYYTAANSRGWRFAYTLEDDADEHGNTIGRVLVNA